MQRPGPGQQGLEFKFETWEVLLASLFPFQSHAGLVINTEYLHTTCFNINSDNKGGKFYILTHLANI